MDKITHVKIKPLNSTLYKPFTLHYTQNGTRKTWDLLIIEDTIAVLVYNLSRNSLLFLKQFRPAVYYGSVPENDRKDTINTKKYPPEMGITIELCSAVVTNTQSVIEDVKQAVMTTFGYDIPATNIQKMASYRSGVGTTGSKQTAFYCEVTDEMKVAIEATNKDEFIEVVEMPVEEAKNYVTQKQIRSPQNFLFGVYWFLYNKT